MKNIIVLVSSGGTNLQSLIDAGWAGENQSGRIIRVISSNPQAYALKRAEAAGIKTKVVDRKKYGDSRSYSLDLLKIFRYDNADLIVYAGFMVILDECVCKEFKNRMINVHPSLIPSFCGKGYYGLKVHEAALEKGVKVSGATVHFVNEVCDAGPIILQKAVEVKQNDTPETLQARIMTEAEHVILPRAVELFCDDKLKVNGNKVFSEVY
ncbi:MAG: phosphoribosylglycinamide formyltransferase [Eubacterium sp.]|jgi:phosphoribosylglycinamide formyltransferase-1|nr:phosphoribosylglycinamide formyltransferase [Eubacterium sp.]